MKEQPIDIVKRELEALDIPYEVIKKKHTKVRFYLGGKKLTYTMPTTASDRRAIMNTRAGLRRLLRKNGAAIN